MSDGLRYFHPKHGIVRVGRGFSWTAFAFGSVWAIAKRLWFPVFAVLLSMEIGLWFVAGYGEAREDDTLSVLGAVAALALAIVRGRYGNRWIEAGLQRRGFAPLVRSARAAAPLEPTG